MTDYPTMRQHQRSKGLTLVEVLVAASLLSLILAGLTGVATACRSQNRSQQETASASYAMEQAFEDLHGAGWSNLTNADSLRTLMSNLDTRRLSDLREPSVKVTVSAYPPLNPQPSPVIVERGANGSCSILSVGSTASLRTMLAVRVDVRLSWISANNSIPRYREVSTVISLSGLLK
jgi:prepilin-type N-terminal cleavage/methylation domain-containing protein